MTGKHTERQHAIVSAGGGRLAARSAGLASRGLAMLRQMAARANRRSGLGWTSLHIAALGDRKRLAEMLIGQGEDVSARDKFGHTPLFFARSAYIAQVLISHGADVNARRDDTATPLHRAARSGLRQVARALLNAGAEVDAQRDRATPLMVAARCGHWSVVDLLLAHGANVNARDDLGETPLSAALSGGHEDVAGLLRRHGANE